MYGSIASLAVAVGVCVLGPPWVRDEIGQENDGRDVHLVHSDARGGSRPNVARMVDYLRRHARSRSTGKCAAYVRRAIEAGGVGRLQRRAAAKDYGPSLIAAGFKEVVTTGGLCEKGDVVVIQACKGHPRGHMAMYDGSRWISDFVQSGLYPSARYRKEWTDFKVYRL
jgi:hypothetical protein